MGCTTFSDHGQAQAQRPTVIVLTGILFYSTVLVSFVVNLICLRRSLNAFFQNKYQTFLMDEKPAKYKAKGYLFLSSLGVSQC